MRSFYWGSGLFSSVLLSSLAYAAPELSRLEEVVVQGDHEKAASMSEANSTGSRLNMTSLETPATIQIVTGDAMRLRGDTNVISAVTRVAGITSQATPGNGGFGFAARGFPSASVTILYDGTKSLINTGSMTYPYDTWNVERIDALNGPASVLYGSGAIGAAINVIPRAPSVQAGNTVRLIGGSFNTYSAALDSTGPLSDELLYRFNTTYTDSDGYIDDGDTRVQATSGALAWLPTDALRVTLSADYGDRDEMAYQGTPFINGKVDKSRRDINYITRDSKIAFVDHRVTLKVDWQASDNVAVRNITTYMRGERLWHYPSTFTYLADTNQIRVGGFGTYDQHQDQYGNYTDVVWTHKLFGLENTLAAGFDFANLSNDRFVDTYTGSASTIITDLDNTNPGVFPAVGPNNVQVLNYQETLVDQYSVFVEDRLKLTEDLAFVTGVRLDRSEVERKDLDDGTTAKKTFEPTSWRAGLVYELLNDFNIYAQHSVAYDAVSTLCCISGQQLDFALSKGKQTEIGLKQMLWNGQFEWSVAVYDIEKDNLLTPNPAVTGQFFQVGSQSSRGIEAAMLARLGEQWLIEMNGTVLNAEYDEFSERVGSDVVPRDGQRTVNAPERSGNLWVTWSFLPEWSAQTAVRYVGDSFIDTANTQRLPSYTVVDFGLHWDATRDLGFDLRAKNAFDKFYANTSRIGHWMLAPERSYEIQMTAKF